MRLASSHMNVDANNTADGVVCPTSPPTTIPTPGSGISTTYLGATINYYDSNGNLIATTDPAGYTSITAYTPTGLTVPAILVYYSVSAEAYSIYSFSCPSYGKSQLGATMTTYDDNGNIISTTSPIGATTNYSYYSTFSSGGYPGRYLLSQILKVILRLINMI